MQAYALQRVLAPWKKYSSLKEFSLVINTNIASLREEQIQYCNIYILAHTKKKQRVSRNCERKQLLVLTKMSQYSL